MTSDLRAQLQTALGAAYTVERELGGGGMSRVFVAIETALGRHVVVKVLPPDLAAELSIERFRREIQVAAQLQNPHIVPLLSAGEGQGLLYYTMPFVEGESLRARMARDGELPVPAAVQVMRDVTKALAYAHKRGVVHRDIKPENILLSEDDALVADFGVAKALSASTTSGGHGLTSIGMAIGTPAYMAPEQALGDAGVDARADLYALGAVAYEVLTGSSLFPGRSPQALVAAHSTEMPESVERRRPNIPPALASLVMRLLAKRPADRPQSADDVLRELDAITTTGGTGLTSAAVAAGALASKRRRPVPPWLAAAALVVVVAGGAFVVTRTRHADPPAAAAPGASDASLAVLPFVNMSGDKENEYFSDGMTEELIDRLANVRGLRVTARTSAFAFKGKDVDIREIGRQLGVRNVVEGSVRRSGSKIRVTAQLISVDNGYHVWSHAYDGDLKDVFAVQEQIGNAIAGALQLALAGRDSAVLARAPTRDTTAHRLYLQGRFLWNQRTGESLTRAAELFQAAIARDSAYADAYAALAETYTLLPFYLDIAADSAYTLTIAAARSALARDSSLAGPHSALGNVYAGRFEWAEALLEYEHAIALNPTDPTPRHWYALTLGQLGRWDEAKRQARTAVVIDPLSLVSHQDLSAVLQGSGDLEGAEAEARSVIDLDPRYAGGWGTLGDVLVSKHMLDSAIVILRRGVALEHPRVYAPDLAYLGYVLALTGHRDSALAIQRELTLRAQRTYVSPAALGILEIGLGHRDLAIALFVRALDSRDAFMDQTFPWDPMFDSVRSDPRFADLKRRANLH